MSLGVLLVSAEVVKSFSNTNENLDESLLLPNIQIAQEIGLQTLLSTKFYNHILNAAQNGTLTAAETTLLEDYIQPYLLWRAVYEAIPTMYMRMMNKSISIGESPNAKSVDKGDMSYLRNIHQNRYEFYSQRLQDYIAPRNADYPLYFQFNSNEGGMPSASVNYFSGIQIPNGPRRPFRFWSGGLPTYTDPTGRNCCG
tara:strand:- start:1314 stop:1907 length:594 start_codon:yes stop_codon:yes gene_type:complete